MANETAETVTDFILGGSKITADGNCSHEIKRQLILGRKAMTNLDCVVPVFWWCFFFFFFNSPIHFSSWPPARINRKAFWKGIGSYHHNQLKATVSPVVMYGCESWTIKKAECQRIDAFKLWCWRRLLRVP